jgi:hypothetical protein
MDSILDCIFTCFSCCRKKNNNHQIRKKWAAIPKPEPGDWADKDEEQRDNNQGTFLNLELTGIDTESPLKEVAP